MCNFKIPQSKCVEVACDNATGKNMLLPDSDLQLARILGAAAYDVGDVSNGPQTGTALQANAIFEASFLTLVSKSQEVIAQIPLKQLNPASNGGIIREFDVPNLDVTKCYISTPNGVAADTNKIWLLEFYYQGK